ncbi:MAG: gliding motility lipoprotein GldH [Tannerella sp.]|jgi:gliding motility-associated lipoprotein GldH|nr:gliding motility lipoprotein GldH [Tannerella sp.]
MRFSTKEKLQAIIFSVSLCLFCFSCTSTDFYNQYQIIDEKWEKEKEFYFTFEIEDNSSLYNLSVEIRNNNSYPYQNLWLFCTEEQPVGPIWRDTIECTLADDFGKWYGTGMSIFHQSIPIRTTYKFPYKSQYTFSIRQGMRDSNLQGIEEIGVRIEKVIEKE